MLSVTLQNPKSTLVVTNLTIGFALAQLESDHGPRFTQKYNIPIFLLINKDMGVVAFDEN
jgi:hypothetical protein